MVASSRQSELPRRGSVIWLQAHRGHRPAL